MERQPHRLIDEHESTTATPEDLPVQRRSGLKHWLTWKCYAAYDRYCRIRLRRFSRGLLSEMDDYMRSSATTGTKYPTLWRAVSLIRKHKPTAILECGTGLSTVVIAHTIEKLRESDSAYRPKFVSMESMQEWFDAATARLPAKYEDTVELVFGPREKYEFLMFRGYAHSNLPDYDFDFVFLDGPAYTDDRGTSFCADILNVVERSSAGVIRGVIDTRVSSCFVLQLLYGVETIRYFPVFRVASFRIGAFVDKDVAVSSDFFRSSITGRLTAVLRKTVR